MRTFLLTLVHVCLLVLPLNAHAAKPIRIGYVNWADNLATTHVVKTIIENRMDREVELVNADIAAIFEGVASGDLDVFTEAALPSTHQDYYNEVASDIIALGPMYPRLRQGWVVPEYVPESAISSIEDLKSERIREKLGGRIVGIDPGSGLMRISRETMKEYGLEEFGYTLQASSGPGMTSALKRAIENEEWILVTGWQPHWKWARWDLRFIADKPGEGALYENYDTTTTIVNEYFLHEAPQVFDMLDRITIPMDELQQMIFEAQSGSYPEAAKAYVNDHPAKVAYWVTGERPE